MTLDRLRIHATLMAAALWTVLAFDYSVPGPVDRFGKAKGTDFVHFYVSGSLAREAPDRLFDFEAHHTRGRAITPDANEAIYVPIESPQVALAFAPLTTLPYTAALAVWMVLAGLVYAGAAWLMWTVCPALRMRKHDVMACCVACPAFYSTVLHGQLSIVSLAAVCAGLLAIARGRLFAAGLAFGCLVFKPHWVLAAGAVFVLAREWRVVAGIAVSAAAQLSVTYAIVGRAVMTAYVTALRSIAAVADLLEPRAGCSLRAFFKVFVPNPALAAALYAAAAFVTLVVAARVWRSGARFEIRASTIVIAMLLISPHAYEYDLILLVPVFFLIANLAASTELPKPRLLHWALAALFVAPLLNTLPAPVRLQFSVTAMAVVMWLTLGRASSSGAWPAWPEPAPAARPSA
jgi:hypothetical protein